METETTRSEGAEDLSLKHHVSGRETALVSALNWIVELGELNSPHRISDPALRAEQMWDTAELALADYSEALTSDD